MKNINNLLLAFILIFALPALSQAKNKAKNPAKVDICEKAAWAKTEVFFDAYVADYVENAKADLEEGEEINEDAIPNGLMILQSSEDTISFGWGENEECACGVEVETKKSADGQKCDAEVKTGTASCECG